ncbi:MAG: hypothetical protein RIR26_1397 [Pseudomonadota bacterium]|jgi:hypothetical protein
MSLRIFILANPWFRAAAAAALVQQILVAGGTFLMGDITTRLPVEGLSWQRCALLLLCLSLSGSVVFFFMNLFSLRSQRAALALFFERYFKNTFNRPLFWRQSDERSKRHDMMCREAQEALQEGNAFFLDLWTTGWNILLNTVSVVLVIGAQSGAVILTAGLLSSLLVHFASAKLSENAIDEMEDQNRLNSHLTTSWDNLTLGNALSFQLWKNRFQSLFSQANGSAEKSLTAREKILAAGNLFTSSALVISVFVQAWLHQNQTTTVLGLFAMLPRTLQINMHVQIIHSYWAGWQRLRERLQMASECFSDFPDTDAALLMKTNAIRITGHAANKVLSPSELLAQARELTTGRLTIRGDNGAGKSVLLSLLKEQFSERAFYLPAQHSLSLPDLDPSLSHGEKALAALRSLVPEGETAAEEKTDIGVLLLDEWDANLSPENREQMSERIEQIAKHRLVIEVRHNQDNLTLVSGHG